MAAILRAVLTLTLACLVLAPTARGSLDESKLDQMASRVAGKSVDAQCESDAIKWDAEVRSTGWNGQGYIYGYVPTIGTSYVRLSPYVCTMLERGPGSPSFGEALNVLAHESSHARGIADEPMAACWGLLWAADLARTFYGVEFFTRGSESIMRGARVQHERLWVEYRKECP